MDKRGRLNRQLGANLRAIRIARGFTQEAWAAHLGYDRTYVASVERGERNLTLDTLTALAEQIEVDPLELLESRGAAEATEPPAVRRPSRRRADTPDLSPRSQRG